MRTKKNHRIIVDGKTIASRRTTRDLVGAIVTDQQVCVGTSYGSRFGSIERLYQTEPRVVRWVKKAFFAKTNAAGVTRVDQQVERMKARGLLKNARFIKAA